MPTLFSWTYRQSGVLKSLHRDTDTVRDGGRERERERSRYGVAGVCNGLIGRRTPTTLIIWLGRWPMPICSKVAIFESLLNALPALAAWFDWTGQQCDSVYVYVFGQDPHSKYNIVSAWSNYWTWNWIWGRSRTVQVGIKQREIKATKEIPVCILTASAAQHKPWYGRWDMGDGRWDMEYRWLR